MKLVIISTIIIGLITVIMGTQADKDQFAGYSQLVSRVFSGNDSKRAHDLDLSKYRPTFRQE